MERNAEQAIIQVVDSLHKNFGENLTIEDMARVAKFSRFHFSRLFQQATGVSPARFLSALRLYEAKRLLVSTSLSVTEISHRVGYTSVGTFSTRFTSSVGASPTTYRQRGGFSPLSCYSDVRPARSAGGSTIRGRIRAQHPEDLGLVFAGVFPGRIPEGRPLRCTVIPRPGPYVLEDVPQGNWYLLAHSVSADRDEAIRAPLGEYAGISIGAAGPFTVRPGRSTMLIDLSLRPKRALDPPVLLALLDIREWAFHANVG
ncbi:helix-turn-helix domain-containing protein [Amycolatopsis anabasis]|uniref:helix-turn-helix domain-containing protein n=1 Tax=Amycolatopsis anabasis TaxID=1840409 RepID=UPI00131DB3F9|nr:AraC family transcriptional regulator [Amycolatopsis anabasis]